MLRPTLYINQLENHIEHAKLVLCKENTFCGQCNSCKQWNDEQHPDWMILKATSTSIGVDQIDEIIQRSSTYPKYADIKLISILNAELITEAGQNKLLKSLEDKNETLGWTLYSPASMITNLLNTIISRVKVDHATDKVLYSDLDITKEWINYIKNGGAIPNEKIDDLGNALYTLMRDKNTTNKELSIYIKFFDRFLFMKKYESFNLKIKNSSAISLILCS
ncbi:MAG: hypothetical protein CMF41_05020 [Legionellales bacterium]|nr:hypothetical protein [Legionellales bacterium]OUX64712.1 MAG: hypothetical protein CBE41_02675 [Gammaproteobacteria bacterium TMED281]